MREVFGEILKKNISIFLFSYCPFSYLDIANAISRKVIVFEARIF